MSASGDDPVTWVFYRDVFGDWHWERAEEGGLIAESAYGFESKPECIADAMRNGYAPATKRRQTPELRARRARESGRRTRTAGHVFRRVLA